MGKNQLIGTTESQRGQIHRVHTESIVMPLEILLVKAFALGRLSSRVKHPEWPLSLPTAAVQAFPLPSASPVHFHWFAFEQPCFFFFKKKKKNNVSLHAISFTFPAPA